MIVAGQRLPIRIATRSVDFRCGHQALALMVQTELKLDPILGDGDLSVEARRSPEDPGMGWHRNGAPLSRRFCLAEGAGWQGTSFAGSMRALCEGLDWRRVMAQSRGSADCGKLTGLISALFH
jgi:transposase